MAFHEIKKRSIAAKLQDSTAEYAQARKELDSAKNRRDGFIFDAWCARMSYAEMSEITGLSRAQLDKVRREWLALLNKRAQDAKPDNNDD